MNIIFKAIAEHLTKKGLGKKKKKIETRERMFETRMRKSNPDTMPNRTQWLHRTAIKKSKDNTTESGEYLST